VNFPLIFALVLGLRHALDADHLAAVSTLLLNQKQSRVRRAAVLGLAWGLGHGTTLFLFGVPVVLFSRLLPPSVQRGAEVTIGGLIVFFALRLLYRWHRGDFHIHPHRHGSLLHVHGHHHDVPHQTGMGEHSHEHGNALDRSPAASFGIGLVHGVGGSAGIGILLIGTASGKGAGVLALVVFAAATAASMSLLSVAVTCILGQGPLRRRFPELIPVLGCAGVVFGLWYSLGALQGHL